MSQSTQADPRDPSAEVPLSLPKAWRKEAPDGLAAISMFLSGAVMVMRNRYFAWPALLVAVASYVSAKPMRQKDGGSGFSGIVFAFAAMFSAYLPFLFLPNVAPSQVPLPQ
ncbi:hypothetical protein M422DRAFT_178471 [Sphaerobolus stellatus SS14]|uniref:Protein Asterix n=1 Tax=Sphaerobolus stellatus (strain SS14) TaxID=990650 RepID=A0A0C9UQQ0_SPHS4|nr:hypothetical protein M422DRAFT_178471 [Sphaerobolus stellatus SS14]